MGRRYVRWGVGLAAVLWSAALAQEPRELAVYAQLLGNLPAGTAIAVEPRDDSDDNLKLRDLMVARLGEARRPVASDGPLLLRFTSSVTTNRDIPDTGPTGGRGRRGGGLGLGALSSAGSYGKGAAAPRGGGVRHRLTAALERRDGGQVLWKVEVTTALGENDERTLPDRMATALVDALGRNVDTRRPAGDGTPPPNPR